MTTTYTPAVPSHGYVANDLESLHCIEYDCDRTDAIAFTRVDSWHPVDHRFYWSGSAFCHEHAPHNDNTAVMVAASEATDIATHNGLYNAYLQSVATGGTTVSEELLTLANERWSSLTGLLSF